MNNSIHLPSKFSLRKREFGIRLLGGTIMYTKGYNQDFNPTRQPRMVRKSGRLAGLVSLIKRLDDRSHASIYKEGLQKANHHTLPVDMRTNYRYR
jgi:hypothetical protein